MPTEIIREICTYLHEKDYLTARLIVRDIQPDDKIIVNRDNSTVSSCVFLARYGFIDKVKKYANVPEVYYKDQRLCERIAQRIHSFMTQNKYRIVFPETHMMIRPRWPEFERVYLSGQPLPNHVMPLEWYIKMILKAPCPELEHLIMKMHMYNTNYAKIVGRWYAYEDYITSPNTVLAFGEAFHFMSYVERFVDAPSEQLTQFFLRLNCTSFMLKYCTNIAKGRVPEFEHSFMQNTSADLYMKNVLHSKRCADIEDIILKNSFQMAGIYYVDICMKCARWPALEDIIFDESSAEFSMRMVRDYVETIECRCERYERIIERELRAAEESHTIEEIQQNHIHKTRPIHDNLCPRHLVWYAIHNINGGWRLIEDYIDIFWDYRKVYRREALKWGVPECDRHKRSTLRYM